ncbi:MAG TPA: RnfABCDGE type electron transport complex subunit D [Candidatus Brocadiia bacterium]|nr:RnfABCDGE type electron transport complex subunit D [Candidatus Brocadiia bacterium]
MVDIPIRKGVKKRGFFARQPIMAKVLAALVPCQLGAVYFFGWRCMALLAWVTFAGVMVEWLTSSKRGDSVSTACLVTCALFSLSLPAEIPLWMATVGIVFAILFGKEAFGGFGRNVFNPAVTGRAFIYVAFPEEMTGSFSPAFRGFPGGFAKWSMGAMSKAPEWLAQADVTKGIDALTQATPMVARRDFGYSTSLIDLFTGQIGGVFEYAGNKSVLAAGSVGEVSALLILIGGIYLLGTRTANWRIVVSVLLGAVLCNLGMGAALGPKVVPPVPFTLLSGALLYGAFFMATDPVSAPRNKKSMVVYGLLIGALIVFFRAKSIFAGGVAFAILIGNMIAPSLDMAMKALEARKKSAPKPELRDKPAG